jgi:hypothetical protein
VTLWRETWGALPPLERRGLGRGKGSVVRYPDGADRQAAALAEAVRRYRLRCYAVLACFAQGFPIRERGLRWAYGESYRRLRRRMERIAGERWPGPEAPDDHLSWFSGRFAYEASRRPARGPREREVRRRIRETGQDREVAYDAAADLLTGAAERLDPGAVRAFGGPDLAEFAGPFLGRPLPERFGLEGLERITTTSPVRSLERARDVLLVLLEVSRLLARREGVVDRIGRAVRDALSDDYTRALVCVPVLLWIVRTGGFEDLWAELCDLPDDAFEPKRAARLMLSGGWRPARRAALGGGSGTTR